MIVLSGESPFSDSQSYWRDKPPQHIGDKIARMLDKKTVQFYKERGYRESEIQHFMISCALEVRLISLPLAKHCVETSPRLQTSVRQICRFAITFIPYARCHISIALCRSTESFNNSQFQTNYSSLICYILCL